MAEFLRTTMVLNETFAAAGNRRVDDLPVNPLSMVLITLRAQQSAANAETTLPNLLAMLATVEVLYRGSAVISGAGDDLGVLMSLLLRQPLAAQPRPSADNAMIRVTLPLILGMRPFDPLSCFPAARRGELQLALTPAASFTGVDTVSLQIETVELPGAQPERFAKYTTISKTPTATGDHDVDLPIGNPLAGVLLFGTTVPTSTTATASLSAVKLLLDNVESIYPRANWDTLHSDLLMRLPFPPGLHDHVHRGDLAASYTQHQLTGIAQWDNHLWNNYAYLDFDPVHDGNYMLGTAGRSRVNLRITADAADAIRILPVEVLSTGQTPTTP